MGPKNESMRQALAQILKSDLVRCGTFGGSRRSGGYGRTVKRAFRAKSQLPNTS